MVIELILLGIIILLLIIHHFERKDLYNRLMSRTYGEYKSPNGGYTPSRHAQVLEKWRKKGGEDG